MNRQSTEFERGMLTQAAWACAAFGDIMLCDEFRRQVNNLSQDFKPIPDEGLRKMAYIVYFAATGLEIEGYGRNK